MLLFLKIKNHGINIFSQVKYLNTYSYIKFLFFMLQTCNLSGWHLNTYLEVIFLND